MLRIVKNETRESKVTQSRIDHNKLLCSEIKNGEKEFTTFTSTSSWFPPRPIIKKDKNEMNRLYNKKT